MWMCSRCQAINDGDGVAGESCPKCGTLAPERTLPPRPASAVSAPEPVLSVQSPVSFSNGSSPAVEPLAASAAANPVRADRGSTTLPPDEDTPKYSLEEPEEEELSEEEYQKVTAQSQLLKSPILAAGLILVAIVAVGTALYTTSTASDNDGAIIGPSFAMLQILGQRHNLSEGVNGTWLGTDTSNGTPTPVTYLFQPGGLLSISAADGTTIPASYKIASNSIQIQSSTANGQSTVETDKAVRNGATLTLSRPGNTLVLKQPEAVVGNWAGNMPTGSGTLRLNVSFRPDGSFTLSGIFAGKPQSVNGTYGLFGRSMLIHLPNAQGIAAPLSGDTKLTFDGEQLILLPDTTANPSAPAEIEFIRQ